jgi:hypothetical protein
MIQYTASSMRYTHSVALDRLLRWTVCCVGPSVALDRLLRWTVTDVTQTDQPDSDVLMVSVSSHLA